jgi:hypothetical protein
VTRPSPRVQNERLTDTESKTKTNGQHPTIRPHRLNDKITTTTNNNKNETLKSNQSNRRTSKDKHNGGILSKNPPSRATVH